MQKDIEEERSWAWTDLAQGAKVGSVQSLGHVVHIDCESEIEPRARQGAFESLVLRARFATPGDYFNDRRSQPWWLAAAAGASSLRSLLQTAGLKQARSPSTAPPLRNRIRDTTTHNLPRTRWFNARSAGGAWGCGLLPMLSGTHSPRCCPQQTSCLWPVLQPRLYPPPGRHSSARVSLQLRNRRAHSRAISPNMVCKQAFQSR